ncbi:MULTISPECIES: aminoacyl-tRNA hydrolase [Wolbachia]|uniref:aminoacyl-tRNA hydrolase n=1 Tax=Wolbachia TaxID=953 RepID=UPI001BA6E524|nr:MULTISPECIES: aminoacyl-tRNA hydrolase [unclassified Wolbachia]QUI60094.1 aminoacyl-tRNA hydrolase [Wolbachia endosymbiont of Spodoptera picta]URG40173.1 aminoacyl-tRNA hydrolase [Wolbachia endosymbiont of Ostrinia furnacalis]URG41116.1 aminoacyl-tRNA hydrolase [Wolbachia endosymbiont of Ostrinia scapulalis]
MHLIAGLGNPGSKYELTHHNIGFIVIDAIHKYWNFQSFSNKADYLITSGIINNNKIMLIKPYSFMNNSGIPIAKIKNFYKLSLDNIVVIHDDADLKFGRIKVKKGGSSAGHNGLKSIDSFIGNDYWRLRFGVGRPENRKSLADYVLSKFENFDNAILLVEKIAKNIHLMLQGDNAAFINSVESETLV